MIKNFNYINMNYEKYDYDGKNVVIWGRGEAALYTLMSLKGVNANVKGFVDSFSRGNESFAGYKVYDKESLSKIENLVIRIAVNNWDAKREILYMIESLNLNDAEVLCNGLIYGCYEYDTEMMKKYIDEDKDKIEFVISNLNDEFSKKTLGNLIDYRITNDRKLIESVFERRHKQYFPVNDFLNKDEKEIFLDIGGFDGGSTIDFIEWASGDYEKIYIVEAEDTMFDICRERMNLIKAKNVELVKKAIWSDCKMLSFDNSNFASGSGTVNDEGRDRIESISIDEMCGGEATFVKLDVEGAEMEALIGGEKTITNKHPKLAVSIYHKDKDLWEIPYYLMKKYPFYKFYVRQYTPYTTESILYATE